MDCISFSPEALEIIQNQLYPQYTPVSLSQKQNLAKQYRKNPDEPWQKLAWNERINLFSALKGKEKVSLLATLTIEDLQHFLLVTPHSELLELRLLNEEIHFLPT